MRPSELKQIEQWLDDFLWPEEDPRQRNKRRRILAAATELFVQLGYRKTSIDDVARRAGVAKGTIYLYYRNKAELVFHAAALEKRSYLTLFGPLLDTTLPPMDRLEGLIELGLTRMAEMPLLARLTGGDGDMALAMSEVDASVLERINVFRIGFLMDLLRGAAGDRVPEEVLEARARVLVDLIAAVVAGPRDASRALSLPAYTRAVAEILVHGITEPQPVGRADPQSVPDDPEALTPTRRAVPS